MEPSSLPAARSRRQGGHKVLPPKIASDCFVNLVAVKFAAVCSVVSGDLMVVGFTLWVKVSEVREE